MFSALAKRGPAAIRAVLGILNSCKFPAFGLCAMQKELLQNNLYTQIYYGCICNKCAPIGAFSTRCKRLRLAGLGACDVSVTPASLSTFSRGCQAEPSRKMAVTLNHLTSLDLVRGFVAVGRRMSITLAAADLCLTQSAVSRQVRTLEEMLGVKLFVRGHRSIAFTAEGQRLFQRADEAVKQLQDVVGALGVALASRPVTIAASIGVAGLWLTPRLGHFLQSEPSIDLRIAASSQLSDL